MIDQTGVSAAPSPAEERYAALMARQYRELRRLFDEPEFVVVANAMRGWLVTPADAHLLWMEVSDYLATGPAWEAPGEALPQHRWQPLVDKLRELDDVRVHALVWAAERVLKGEGAWAEVLGGALRGPRDK